MRQSIDFPPCPFYRLPPFGLVDCVSVGETHCIHEAVSRKSQDPKAIYMSPYRVISNGIVIWFVVTGANSS